MNDPNFHNYPGEGHFYNRDKISEPLPTTRQPGKRLMAIFAAIVAALVVIVVIMATVMIHLVSASQPNTSRQSASGPGTSIVSNSTPGTAPTSIPVAPTDTPIPTATPTPLPTLPCTVDVGTWAGGSSDWKSLNGMLLDDGTNPNFNSDNGPTIVAPCQLGDTTNYAVETRIQMNSGNGCFGITVRGTSASDGWQGYMAGVGDCSYYWGNAYIAGPGYTSDSARVQGSFNPGNGPHTYRVEVNGNVVKFLIDGSPLLTLTDNRYLTGSQVGLWSQGVQLQVTSFEVVSL